jgi:hypothetical protein
MGYYTKNNCQSLPYQKITWYNVVHSLWFVSWPTWIHYSLFVLVNLVFLMLYQIFLEIHKEFFILLHALSLGEPWLYSWDHQDLDIEPSLELFCYNQSFKILNPQNIIHELKHGFLWVPHENSNSIDHITFISSNRWSWCKYSKYIFMFNASDTFDPVSGCRIAVLFPQ